MGIVPKRVLIRGTQINYLFVCSTELWYFSHHLQMEHSSDLVAVGKFLHENVYKQERKNIKMDGIAIDFIKKGDIIELHEVKKSPKMEKAHEMQVLYYLYFLKNRGVKNTIAVLDYPTIKKRKLLELTPESESEIENALIEIKKIVAMSTPPPAERKPYCKKCSYYELCWGD